MASLSERPARVPSRKSFALAALALCCSLTLPAAAQAQDASAVDACHKAITKGMSAASRGHIAVVGRCLAGGRYADCQETDQHAIAHENELRHMVAGEKSACQAALDSGATLNDFGPTSCGNAWNDCDTVVPVIANLDDLAECLVCHERGFHFEIRDAIGLPRPAPTDNDESRCTKRLTRLVSKTIRKVLLDTATCARGNVKPFSCPADASAASRFGRALATFPKNVGFCDIDEGKAPGALMNLCGGVATDEASLATCLGGLAKCLACHTTNSALGQSADCAAFSGFGDCDGMF